MTPSPFAEHMHVGFDVAHALARGKAGAGDGVLLSDALRGVAEEYARLCDALRASTDEYTRLSKKYTATLERDARRLQHAIALEEDRLPLRWDTCLDLEIGG